MSVKKNYIYDLSYQILTLITPLITAPYISRVLGAENIGIYSFVNANVAYFILLGVFGLNTYSQLEVARRKDDKNDLNQFCVESILVRCVTMGMSIFIYILIYLIVGESYKLFYFVSLITLIANAIDFTWLCQGLEDFKSISIRNAIVKIASVLSIFIFVRSSDDLVWYVMINALSVFIGNLAIIPTVRRCIYFRISNPIKFWIHIKSAIVYFFPSVVSTFISTFDKLMIGWMTVGNYQNGLYEQATKIESLLFMIFASLNVTMRSRMAYLYKNGNKEETKRYLQKSMSFVVFLALPMCVGLIGISDLFIPIFLGAGYEGTIVLLKIMSFWILIKSISNCLLEQSILQKCGPGIYSKILLIGAIVNICLNGVLIPLYLACGAAIASLLTELIILVITLSKTIKELDIAIVVKNFGKELLSVSVMFICTFIAKKFGINGMLGMTLMFFIGIVSYFGMSFFLKDDMLIEFVRILKGKLKR